MKTCSGRILAFLLAILTFSVLLTFSAAEQASWNCPNCGRTGNTGNFCGGCGNPAPRTQEQATPVAELQTPSPDGVPSTMKQLSEYADGIVRQSEAWTKDTAPQTLDAFPFFPRFLPELYTFIDENPPTLEYDNNACRLRLPWQADLLRDYVPADCNGSCNFNGVFRIGESPAESFYIREETPGVFIVELPEGVAVGDVYEILYFFYDYD